MRVKTVATWSPVARFLYWIQERHGIYLRRQAGQKKPWTDDEILQQYFFTNPYRENDKTTVWFRTHLRDPLRKRRTDALVATIAFRWFNKIETGQSLLREFGGIYGPFTRTTWSSQQVARFLCREKKKGMKPFTGAFMVPAPPGSDKVQHVCKCIGRVVAHAPTLAKEIQHQGSMQAAHEALLGYPYLGGFSAYEVVTDLRYTCLLEEAIDKMTWCNPGPGCARGLWRLQGETLDGVGAAQGCKPPENWLERMRKLLTVANKRLPSSFPRLEMREIEHSLCEFDKYERARLGTGRMKRKYQGV